MIIIINRDRMGQRGPVFFCRLRPTESEARPVARAYLHAAAAQPQTAVAPYPVLAPPEKIGRSFPLRLQAFRRGAASRAARRPP